MQAKRTDLAVEAREIWQESAAEKETPPGVDVQEETISGFPVTTVKIVNEQGAKELCKPVGTYVTVETDVYLRREDNTFSIGAQVLAQQLRALLQLKPGDTVLLAGLGNAAVTPDAVGPLTARHTLATRHLTASMPERFSAFRSVSVIETGVLGTTGVESAELLKSICGGVEPDCVIAVDALASRSLDRVCRTVQLTDTGIVPGSGVGNSRAALNREALGVPVVAVGVPTVVDAATLAADLTGAPRPQEGPAASMIVTPRDIDAVVRDISRLLGYAVNLALHDGLTVQDVDMLVS
jgi:spore protease